MNPLTTYITYNLWANKRLVENINACHAEDVRTVAIAPFGSILDAMRHIVGAQNIWHERAQGISPTDFMGFTEGRSMVQLQDQLLDTSQKWIDLVEKHPHVAEASITYKTMQGEPYS
ncbi:MAG: hypothetical protein NTX15_05920, partial [Candidatus Kapabacteria bacterium]|nr:hypothetical protein [Candidatus Kapabacteria bacterium]